MVRSMYSGVTGMKTHQTRMDTIGNNIANVNTYGFKSSRATFRDIYYQSLRGAAEGSGMKGGLNPSQVGYGVQLGSIDVLQTQSALTNTGNPLDVALSGEGFLQVQDSDGNIFYTRAGMLNIDSFGNLVDLNGNFVLGVSGSPIGKPASSERIQFSIPSVDPSVGKAEERFNGKNFTIESTNQTDDANVTFNFITGADLPLGQRAEAILTSSGVTMRLNPKEKFTSMSDLQDEVNRVIKQANGGVDHPAGRFSIKMDPDPFTAEVTAAGGLTGAQIVGKNFGTDAGKLVFPADMLGGFSFKSASDSFGKSFTTDEVTGGTFTVAHTGATGNDPTAVGFREEQFIFTATIGGQSYYAKLSRSDMENVGSVVFKRYTTAPTATTDGTLDTANSDDTFTMDYPSYTSLMTPYAPAGTDLTKPVTGNITITPNPAISFTATKSMPSKDLGLSSKPIILKGGTEGGPQTVKDLSSISIGADGVITGYHAVHGLLELGRIDLATFENPSGLEESGNTYFSETKNSGAASLAKVGTDGTGMLKNSALEMSNVDLSQEFTDMITTQRGFQANSRIITVSDTMIEELVNLKR